MLALKYLKGVRTRYINNLKEEVSKASLVLQKALDSCSHDELLKSISLHVGRLNQFISKLESQSEKVISSIGESEDDLVTEILNDDAKLCDSANDMILKLQEFEVFVTEKIKEDQLQRDETKAPHEGGQIAKMIEMQEQFQQLVVDQMKHQQEYYERQEKKENEKSTPVKLPKLDICSFSGDKLRWHEFWDTFLTSVHNNKSISDIQKFNYLRGKLYGEAKNIIDGLKLSGDNYHIAVQMLRERYGNEQELIELHYNKIINIQSAYNTVQSLRLFMDTIERHLRSLEVLHQDINQDVFIAMIRTKLPEYVLLQLEMLKGANVKWTLKTLREKLNDYIIARERADRGKSKVHNGIQVDTEGVNKTGVQRNTGSAFYDGAQRSTSGTFNNRTWMNNNSTKNNGAHRSTGGLSTRCAYGPMLGYGPRKDNQQWHTSGEALVANNSNKPSATSKDYSTLCRYCSKEHWSDECPTYRTVEARKRLLKDSCYKCLKFGHKSTDCKRGKKMCPYCGERGSHHRSLCNLKFKGSNTSAHLSEEIYTESQISYEKSEPVPEDKSLPENAMVSSGEMILMQTVRTKISNPKAEKSEIIRILLDSGSQRSYVSEPLARRFNLKTESTEDIHVITFGSSKSKTVTTKKSSLQIDLKYGEQMDISVNIVQVISGTIQRKPVGQLSKSANQIINSVDLADTVAQKTESCEIDMLLGNDYYLDIILGQKLEIQPGLYLLSSKCGWILTGRTEKREDDINDVNMLILTNGCWLTKTKVYTTLDSSLPLKPNLEDFWNVESIGIMDNPDTSDDDKAMSHFRDTLKFSDGRYQVKWPWKDDEPNLPINRQLAYGRLKSVVFKLKKKPELMKMFNDIIEDQRKKGIIEEVDNKNTGTGLVHYMPHHAVITPLKTTTKLRIVYDASAKTKQCDTSLNENLYRGPVMLHDLCGMLMRFRLHKVAIVADIEKAFLQIGIQPSDRDVTRFLWVKDLRKPVTERGNIIEYRFCRVPFGVISSPFLLGANVEYHLDSYGTI